MSVSHFGQVQVRDLPGVTARYLMSHCQPLECPPGGWLPRAATSNCEVYTSGMYVMPCYLPFGSLPPMFLACFFGTLLGLAGLFLGCWAQKPSGEAEAAHGTANAEAVENMSKTRIQEHADL